MDVQQNVQQGIEAVDKFKDLFGLYQRFRKEILTGGTIPLDIAFNGNASVSILDMAREFIKEGKLKPEELSLPRIQELMFNEHNETHYGKGLKLTALSDQRYNSVPFPPRPYKP